MGFSQEESHEVLGDSSGNFEFALQVLLDRGAAGAFRSNFQEGERAPTFEPCVAELVGMGFIESESRRMLELAGGELETALQLLLG